METGLRKGIRAFFDVDGITIAYWASAWTGREAVMIDDRVVSKKWNFRFVSAHRFEHAGVDYRLVYRVVSMLNGHLEIELYRNGDLIDSDQFSQYAFGVDSETGKFSIWRLLRNLAPYFVGGMLLGACAAYLVDYLTGP
jgi:hypothetical protein